MLSQITNEVPIENLIVIHGTSQDKTREIARQYTEKVYWDEDKGLGAARNLGIRKSSSEIVAMIDTDVILPKNWYQKLIRHFGNNKVAAANGAVVYGYGCPPLQKYYEYFRTHSKEDWGCQASMFRRNSILEIGNFNEQVKGAGEDYEIRSRLLRAGFKWIWDKEVIVYHPSNLRENFEHNIWWARGVTSCKREPPFSLLQLLGQGAVIVKRGIIYATVHPILALYIPLIDMVWLTIDFKTRLARMGQNATV